MTDLYRELILDHWRNPRHAGPLGTPTHVGEVVNETCGDSAWVELAISDRVIRDSSVQVSGCALATAAGSILAERIINRSTNDVQSINEKVLLQWLGGIDPAASRRRCATLALEALQVALK